MLLASFISLNSFALEDTSENRPIPTEELIEGIKSLDGRWFEVEVIIFERNDKQSFREEFQQEVKPLEKKRQWDLIREVLQPDISLLLNTLEPCHQDKNPLANIDSKKGTNAERFYQQMMSYQNLLNKEWQFTSELCLLPNESITGLWQYIAVLPELSKEDLSRIPLDEIPNKVTAGDHDDFHNVYTIADQNLKLKSHYFKLKKHPTLNPLLHFGWRQPGLSKPKSRPVYIIAGHNYSEQFRYDGSEILEVIEPKVFTDNALLTEEVELLSSANSLLNNKTKQQVDNFIQQLQSGAKVDFKTNELVYPKKVELPDQTWQLDGYIQIHLNHYLFVNAEFNYREPKVRQVNVTEFVNDDSYLEEESLIQELVTETSTSNIEITSELSDGTSDNTMFDGTTSEFIDINYLENYYFKQNRKFYSGDIHYLDHPKFGVLIQIRKYRH